MNRLQHFLRAKTQFNLHSPFVYGLYTEVLFSRAEGCPRGRYEGALWRLERHYGVVAVCSDGEARLSCSDGEFLVLDHPHRREASWQAVVADARWQATLDFFDYGIAVANPHLSKQHFILR
jgi:hypothetical protein